MDHNPSSHIAGMYSVITTLHPMLMRLTCSTPTFPKVQTNIRSGLGSREDAPKYYFSFRPVSPRSPSVDFDRTGREGEGRPPPEPRWVSDQLRGFDDVGGFRRIRGVSRR
jgi:hypothetical protein